MPSFFNKVTRELLGKQKKSNQVMAKIRNPAFSNLKSEDFQDGIHAHRKDLEGFQASTDSESLADVGQKRVVGKGYHYTDNVKRQVLLFEDGKWGWSEYFIRIDEGKKVASPMPTQSDGEGVGHLAQHSQDHLEGLPNSGIEPETALVAASDPGPSTAPNTLSEDDPHRPRKSSFQIMLDGAVNRIHKAQSASTEAIKSLKAQSDATQAESSDSGSPNSERHPKAQMSERMTNPEKVSETSTTSPHLRGGAGPSFVSRTAQKLSDKFKRQSKTAEVKQVEDQDQNNQAEASHKDKWPTPAEADRQSDWEIVEGSAQQSRAPVISHRAALQARGPDEPRSNKADNRPAQSAAEKNRGSAESSK